MPMAAPVKAADGIISRQRHCRRRRSGKKVISMEYPAASPRREISPPQHAEGVAECLRTCSPAMPRCPHDAVVGSGALSPAEFGREVPSRATISFAALGRPRSAT